MSEQLSLFDYKQLSPELAIEVQAVAERVHLRMRRAAKDIIEIGKDLIEIKAKLPHGCFLPWIESEFGMSHKTARNFMLSAEKFGEKVEIISTFNPTVIFELTSAPDEVIEKAIASSENGDKVSVKEVLEWKKQATPREPGEYKNQPEPTPLALLSVFNNDSYQEEVSGEFPTEDETLSSREPFITSVPNPTVSPRKERHDLDFYETPRKITEFLLRYWQPDVGDTVLEPSGGHGAITDVLKERGLTVITNDIDPAKPADYHFDASIASAWDELPIVDWIVTNPPFSSATDIIPFAYEKARKGVIALLRLTYLEPCLKNRGEWLASHGLSLLIPFNPRPRFRSDTDRTDMATVAWFVWKKVGAGALTKIVFANNWNKEQDIHQPRPKRDGD